MRDIRDLKGIKSLTYIKRINSDWISCSNTKNLDISNSVDLTVLKYSFGIFLILSINKLLY